MPPNSTHPSQLRPEQLPVPAHQLHHWTHFAGLYAAEHVAATECVIGATFVALGATTMDIIIGLLVGNVLAILSWTLITTPIAVETRLSLYTYLKKIAGDRVAKLYDWANVLIFTVISAAMVTVSATAVRFAFDIPAQLDWYPTNAWFVLIVVLVGAFVVFISIYGFEAVSKFSGICAPWLFTMFAIGYNGRLDDFSAAAGAVRGCGGVFAFCGGVYGAGATGLCGGGHAGGGVGVGVKPKSQYFRNDA